MSEDRLLQCSVWHSTHHRYLKRRHQLAALNSQHRATKYLIRVRVNHRLDEAASLTHLNRAGYVSQRQLSHADVQAALASFRLGQPNPTELRVHENGIRNKSIACSHVAAFYQVCADDSKVVVRDVSELRASVHIAERVDTCHVGFEPGVDLYE